jgi:hypothetical protein
MREQRGMILHVMQGLLAGSIAWGKNPASQVSFHFGTSRAGVCQQLVDTDVTAWTQGSGNGSWVSVENEDYSGNPLSANQVEAVARLYARGVRDYGWPYQLADETSGRGLGWHGMGGQAWGGHLDCPGAPIIGQRQQILDRARQINGVAPTPPHEEDPMHRIRSGGKDGSIYLVPGYSAPDGRMAAFGLDGPANEAYAAFPLVQLPDGVTVGASGRYNIAGAVPWPAGGGGSVSGPVDLTPAAIAAVADAVADEAHNRLAD